MSPASVGDPLVETTVSGAVLTCPVGGPSGGEAVPVAVLKVVVMSL